MLQWHAHQDSQGHWYARITSEPSDTHPKPGAATGLAPHKYLQEFDPIASSISDSNEVVP